MQARLGNLCLVLAKRSASIIPTFNVSPFPEHPLGFFFRIKGCKIHIYCVCFHAVTSKNLFIFPFRSSSEHFCLYLCGLLPGD